MRATPLYPLRFEPIYQYRPWGGRRLDTLLSASLPGDGPIGEAWLLSDREEYASRVVDGPLKGKTIGEVAAQSPDELLGRLSGRFRRFPLLLKLLDVKDRLSVQVHPSNADRGFLPIGETGKTEAWVVLESGPGARIFAGFKRSITAGRMRRALAEGGVAEELAEFTPEPGDAVLIRAGTVHSLADVVVFELQQNSDVTFRLFDWDHVDSRTRQPRSLQVEQAMACLDFGQGPVLPLVPRVEKTAPVLREDLIRCQQFGITRISGRVPFIVGCASLPRVLACLAGAGQVEYAGRSYPLDRGQVLLLPAVAGECLCRPQGAMSILEISPPERP
jgi:mannose-6-phosphate isomerase